MHLGGPSEAFWVHTAFDFIFDPGFNFDLGFNFKFNFDFGTFFWFLFLGEWSMFGITFDFKVDLGFKFDFGFNFDLGSIVLGFPLFWELQRKRTKVQPRKVYCTTYRAHRPCSSYIKPKRTAVRRYKFVCAKQN